MSKEIKPQTFNGSTAKIIEINNHDIGTVFVVESEFWNGVNTYEPEKMIKSELHYSTKVKRKRIKKKAATSKMPIFTNYQEKNNDNKVS